MNKKAATVGASLILVFMAVALVGVALFVLLTHQPENKIIVSKSVEDVYIKENQINFLVSQGLDLEKSVQIVGGEIKTGGIVELKSEINGLTIIYQFKFEKDKV